MSSYQEIERHSLGIGTEALYVADETNHAQWISDDFVEKFGGQEPDIPVMMACDTCGDQHQWRKVYVKA